MKESYQEYLASDRWKRIRAIVMKRDKNRCRSCQKSASQVHHGDYRAGTLRGSNLRMLFALCGGCHLLATFDLTGRRRSKDEVKVWALDLVAATRKKGHQKRKKKPRGSAHRRAGAVKVSSSIDVIRALSERYAYGDQR